MLYRENGQFKTSYAADQQLLPIAQDRWFMMALVACSLIAVPLLASDYALRALIIPFLILTIAAIGLNILVGYCGQISVGSAAFMGVGAYLAYNLTLRVPQLNFLVVLVLSGLGAALVGIAFGIPSLRIKGLYLAVATLAAQFFLDWAALAISLFNASLLTWLGLTVALNAERPRRAPPGGAPVRSTCSAGPLSVRSTSTCWCSDCCAS